jgi:YggT family protein
MHTLIHYPFYTLGLIYIIILVARAVLSWFPIEPRSPVGTINHWLYALTEPYVSLFRRVIPPMGMLDVSYFVAVLVVWIFSDLVLTRIYI